MCFGYNILGIGKKGKNLTLYLNTSMIDVEMEKSDRIAKIYAVQLPTEKKYKISGNIFVDATGDGTLAALSGADFMVGREAKDIFGEKHGLEKSDNYTMGNTIMFTTVDMGRKIEFHKPSWAYTYTEEDLKYRKHLPGEAIWRAKAGLDSGYWWIELGGRGRDIISEGENIRDELLKVLYGVWDHIKNGGEHGADNLALDWIGFVPGKRESRRITGDYVLREEDLMENHLFKDAVAYGGWTLDQHTLGGMENLTDEPAHLFVPPVPYQIPYRCYYSKNITNLMMAGRNISCSHLAMSSTRVMATCMVGGQAVGVAAALAVKKKLIPREVGEKYISQVQQELLKDDCYIPEINRYTYRDMARKARVTASCSEPGYEPENIINGIHRSVAADTNMWLTKGLQKASQWIDLEFETEKKVQQIIIRFDSDLSSEIFVSINKKQLEDQEKGVPSCLVKDYELEFYQNDTVVYKVEEKNNFFRHRIHNLEKIVTCDKLRLIIKSTNGSPETGVFEIRVY